MNIPAFRVGQLRLGSPAGGASGTRQYAKLGILNMPAPRFGVAAFATRSVCVAGASQHDGILARLDSGTSTHFMSDISLFHSFDDRASNACFSSDAGTMITSRAVSAVKFEAKHCDDNFRIITLENVYCVPQQQHDYVAVCQLTHCLASTCGPPDFKTRTW